MRQKQDSLRLISVGVGWRVLVMEDVMAQEGILMCM